MSQRVFIDEETLPDWDRYGIHRLNKRVAPVPKKRKRFKPSREEMEPGALCGRCGKTEAGVKGIDSTPRFYRLHWECQACGLKWDETKVETPGLPAPGSDMAAGGKAAG